MEPTLDDARKYGRIVSGPHRGEELSDVNETLDTDEDAGFCEICGEHFHPGDELGEFVNGDGDSVIAHSECGLGNGFAIA